MKTYLKHTFFSSDAKKTTKKTSRGNKSSELKRRKIHVFKEESLSVLALAKRGKQEHKCNNHNSNRPKRTESELFGAGIGGLWTFSVLVERRLARAAGSGDITARKIRDTLFLYFSVFCDIQDNKGRSLSQ